MSTQAPRRQARVLAVVRQHRAALLRREAKAVAQLQADHRQLAERIARDAQALQDRMSAALARGERVRPSWLHTVGRLDELAAQLQAEVASYATRATGVVQAQLVEAAALGQRAAGAAVAVASGGTSPAIVGATLPAEALAGMRAVTLGPAPVGKVLADMAPQAAEALRQQLLQGLALGENPRVVASRMRRVADVPLARARTVARTEALRAYRGASVATYQQVQDVAGWVWVAAMDSRCCGACMALHGTEWPDGQAMESHPNCRCVPAPLIPGEPPLVEPGAVQMAGMSEGQLAEVLGPGKARALTEGRIIPADLVGARTSPVWGVTRTEASLQAALRAAERRRAGARPPAPAPAPPAPPPPPPAPPAPAPAAQAAAAAPEATLAELEQHVAGLREAVRNAHPAEKDRYLDMLNDAMDRLAAAKARARTAAAPEAERAGAAVEAEQLRAEVARLQAEVRQLGDTAATLEAASKGAPGSVITAQLARGAQAKLAEGRARLTMAERDLDDAEARAAGQQRGVSAQLLRLDEEVAGYQAVQAGEQLMRQAVAVGPRTQQRRPVQVRLRDLDAYGEFGPHAAEDGSPGLHLWRALAGQQRSDVLQANTYVHEVGHYLDWSDDSYGYLSAQAAQALRDATFRQGLVGVHGAGRVEAMLGVLQAALADSTPIRRLVAMGKGAPSQVRHSRYALDPREVWARAFAQYVATKAAKRGRPAHLRNLVDTDPDHWPEAEFDAIEAAIDRYVEASGWQLP